MPRGGARRDENVIELAKMMEPDQFVIYELPDPEARDRSGRNGQHPAQKAIQNFGKYHGKKFRTFVHKGKLYLIRIE